MSLAALVPSLALAATAAVDLPPLDALLTQSPARDVLAQGALFRDVQAHVRAGRISSTEERYGVPTFFWAAREPNQKGLASVGLTPEQAARRHLYTYAELYRFEPSKLA